MFEVAITDEDDVQVATLSIGAVNVGDAVWSTLDVAGLDDPSFREDVREALGEEAGATAVEDLTVTAQDVRIVVSGGVSEVG